jgi:hypothetical protein
VAAVATAIANPAGSLRPIESALAFCERSMGKENFLILLSH